MNLSRRHFLESLGLGSFAYAYPLLAEKVDTKSGMPTRILGKTGARVSILGMGCGSRLLSYEQQDKAAEALNKALAAGVNYLDTAFSYGNGKSETWVGSVIKGRRQGLWITTKIQERDGAKAMKIIEESLKRLNTDQVDLIHIHSLLREDDLAKIEAKGGVLETLRKAKDQKMTRFIGVTSHTDPKTLATALDRHEFDCTQMALNAALVGMTDGKGKDGKGKMVINKELKDSFETIALPVALRKKMGVTAMKVYGQEELVGAAPMETLLRYGLSLPVAAAIVGMPKLEFIDDNARMAKAFKPLGKKDMQKLSTDLSREHKARLDRFFADHVDA